MTSINNVVYVLDSSAIFLRKIPYNSVTVPEVVEEIIDENSKLYFQVMNVKVEDVGREYVSKVVKIAEQTGDIYKLSNTDIKVLAKAVELKDKGYNVHILTDDYSIQNVAKNMKITVEPVVQQGISKVFKWVKVCKGCGRKVEGDVCPICGSEVVLRRVRCEETRRSCSKSKKTERKRLNDRRNSG